MKLIKGTLAAVAALALTPVFCPAQEIGLQLKLDHFVIYEIKADSKPTAEVKYKGQFDRDFQPLKVGNFVLFGYPCSKDKGKVLEKNEFLAIFKAQGEKQPKREVVTKNQFGEQELILGQIWGIVAPTTGLGPAKPKVLDHYVAYEVLEASESSSDRDVEIEDEFSGSGATIVKPAFFCVPIDKIHGKTTTKIQNPKAHLTIYEIKSAEEKPKGFGFQNQFQSGDASRTNRKFIALPTLKLAWEALR